MKSTLKLYLDLARAELRMAARHSACGYIRTASHHHALAKGWIATYWHAKPRA